MRRTSIIAAAIGGLFVASSSFAGFTVTAAPTGTAGGFDSYVVTAVNTGGDTGTQIKGLEYFYNGAPVSFDVTDTDEDGTPDTVSFASGFAAATKTRIRVATAAANNVYVGLNPAGTEVQPNPYMNALSAFQGAIANIGTTQASGTGYQIAKFFLPTGTSGVFSGNIGGDVGTKVPFSVNLGSVVVGGTTTPTLPNGTTVNGSVVFGSIVTNGAPFSVQIAATDPDANALLQLAVGAAPSGISNIQISPASSGSPATFTVSGLVDYSLNGSTVQIPFTVTDDTGRSVTGTISLNVVPEPASLAAFGLSGLLLGRRRK